MLHQLKLVYRQGLRLLLVLAYHLRLLLLDHHRRRLQSFYLRQNLS
jgi:hypothetical protein